jgi:hypothetical protein
MHSRYFISASFPVDVRDDRVFARRSHALAELPVGVLHVAAVRSGADAYSQTTNGNAQKDTREVRRTGLSGPAALSGV